MCSRITVLRDKVAIEYVFSFVFAYTLSTLQNAFPLGCSFSWIVATQLPELLVGFYKSMIIDQNPKQVY